MSLAAVQDFLHTFPGQSLISLLCGDEQAPLASGSVITRELRPPLWMIVAKTRKLSPNTLAIWQARLESLDNGKTLFWGYDRNRNYPIAYPKGSWPTGGGSFNGTTCRIHSVNANNKALSLDQLPANYAGKAGDMVSWNYNSTLYALHRVVEDFAADGSGVTPEFEVRPHIRATATVTTAVAVKRPACQMRVIPGTLQSDIDFETGWGSLAFQAMQSL